MAAASDPQTITVVSTLTPTSTSSSDPSSDHLSPSDEPSSSSSSSSSSPLSSHGPAQPDGDDGQVLVILFDGTLNDHLQHPDPVDKSPSNVMKIFHCLDGQVGQMKPESWPEMRQDLLNKKRGLRAHYQIGVGVNEGMMDSLKAAGHGIGILSRVIRAWMWLSRHYQSDKDRIVIIGFSRGAYTSCIFSHLLIYGGFLTHYRRLCLELEAEYREAPREEMLRAREKFKIKKFQEAIVLFTYWYMLARPLAMHPLPKDELKWTLSSPYLHLKHNTIAERVSGWFHTSELEKLVNSWPETVPLQKKAIKATFNDFEVTLVDKDAFRKAKGPVQPAKGIAGSKLVLGLWDVVPSIGEMFTDASGRRLQHDHLAPMVIPDARVFHAVALDETRIQFTPRVFAPVPGLVEQKFFVGDHSDVGGSYAFFSEPHSTNPHVHHHHEFLKKHRPKPIKGQPDLSGSAALPREPSRDPDDMRRATTEQDLEPFHECCLSDISLGWMIHRLDSAIRLADGGSIFQPQFSAYGAELESEAPNWERFRTEPLLIQVRPSPGIHGLWQLPIRLLPDPHGLAHLEGTQLFPRLFPSSVQVYQNLHSSVHRRAQPCARSAEAQRYYIFHSREKVISTTKKRSIQTHKYRLFEFSTVLTHLIGNEDPTAKAVRGDTVLALFTM